jgi:hypothetical protein
MASIDMVREIHKLASSYLGQPGDIESFIVAFNALSFNVHKKGDQAGARLADNVEAILADVRAGFMSMHDFQKSLREIIAPAPVAYYYSSGFAGFSQSVNEVAVVEKPFPAASSGTSPEVVFGSANLLRA